MVDPAKLPIPGRDLRLSFEYFPPKSDEMEAQLFETVAALDEYQPDFVTVTYGAGGSTKARSLTTVGRLIADAGQPRTAAHLTCVGASREEVDGVVAEFARLGVRHFVALRGDPQGGVGAVYQPFPGGYENGAALTAAIRDAGDFEISVSAYPEKHPESADTGVDIDMLKRKVDNGATRAITQFFFDNADFERYLERVRAAGITVPILPGILPIQNLAQVSKFAGLCGARVPQSVVDRLEPLEHDAQARFSEAADLAAEQILGLAAIGIADFHLYTMNRAPLVSAVCDRIGIARRKQASARVQLSGAAA